MLCTEKRTYNNCAVVAQSVEHFIGNEEVHGFDSRQQLQALGISGFSDLINQKGYFFLVNFLAYFCNKTEILNP